MPTLQPNPFDGQPSVDDGISSPEGGLILYRISTQICTRPNVPVLRGINHVRSEVMFFRPNCGCWDCPHCSELLARKWRYRAVNGLRQLEDAGSRADFVTITSHEKLDHAGSLRVLPAAWKKLRIRIVRAAGKCEYFQIPEFHKNGRVHFHMLTTAILPQKWWKDNARQCGFGFMSDVQEVKQLGGVSNYVGKYLTKMLQNWNIPEHFRRVRTSQGFPKLPDMPPNPEWQFDVLPRQLSLQTAVNAAQLDGYAVIVTNGTDAWDIVGMFDGGER